jgi:glycosyltransferase involved in cell wall biosynthesis
MAAVTVALPVWNGLPHLPLAIDCLLAQTCAGLEILVVNDGSTDGTKEYLDSLRDPRIRVLHQGSQGVAQALNRALELTRTPYFGRMDADDACSPSRFEEQLRYLESHPEVHLLGTQLEYFVDEPERSGFAPRLPLDHEAIEEALMRREHAICHPTTLFRTESLRALGGYQPIVAEDWDLFLRLSERHRLANLPAVLHKMRLHETSTTSQRWGRYARSAEHAIACSRARRRGEPEPERSAFEAAWESRPWLRRALERLDAASLRAYRLGIIDWLSRRPLRGALRLAAASALSPGRLLRRARRYLR